MISKMVKRKHKTLYSANKEKEKANKENILGGYNVYRVKNAKIWKYVVATYLEWVNGMY